MDELLSGVLQTVTDVKAGKWTAAARDASGLIRVAASLVDTWTGGAYAASPPSTELDAALGELAVCCTAPVPVAAAEGAIAPARVVDLLKILYSLVQWIRDLKAA